MTRLDYVLAPMGSAHMVNDCSIDYATISDHSPVTTEIVLDQDMRGPGYWKFNVRHLSNLEYVNEINQVVDYGHMRYNNLNPMNRWEMIKMDVREATLDFCRRKGRLRKDRTQNLEKKLRSLKKKLSCINLKATNAVSLIQQTNDKIDVINRELEKDRLQDAQGAMLRSKVRWISQAEHSTKYFFNLEKSNAKAKIMKVVCNQGKIERNANRILQLQAQFYQNLYKATPEFNPNIEGKAVNALSKEEKVKLDKEITLEEVQNVIKSMAKNKTPGTDGFQIDLYIVFRNRLKEFYMSTIDYALDQKILHQLARRGLITLLPKNKRDLRFIKNWRPIILLNTDYKILSKVLANRVKKTLDKLVNKDQTGFIKGRQITENLRKFLDVIEYTDIKNIPRVLVSIDFEKAFDKVQYPALFKVMEWFNFGPKLIG